MDGGCEWWIVVLSTCMLVNGIGECGIPHHVTVALTVQEYHPCRAKRPHPSDRDLENHLARHMALPMASSGMTVILMGWWPICVIRCDGMSLLSMPVPHGRLWRASMSVVRWVASQWERPRVGIVETDHGCVRVLWDGGLAPHHL
jgi:hypothetical protein